MAAWGDSATGPDLGAAPVAPAPAEDRIRVVVRMETREDGTVVQVTDKVRTDRVHLKITKTSKERRERWKKFGHALDPSKKVTFHTNDEIVFETVGGATEEAAGAAIPALVSAAPTLAWASNSAAAAAAAAGGGASTPAAAGGAGGAGLFRPSALSRASGSGEDASTTTELVVTDLADSVSEDELRTLFAKFGYIERLRVVRWDSRSTKAFINYSLRKDAAAAMEEMNGYGLHHIRMKIEWSTRGPRDVMHAGTLSALAGHASGYGKALPQSRPKG